MIDPSAVTLPLAALAGLLSFISPCVLPLVPAYIGYLTGQAANTASSTLAMVRVGADGGDVVVGEQPSRWVVLLHGLFFVLGFSVIFVLLGISAGAIGQLGRQFLQATDWIMRIGGLLIIVLGLHTMGVIRIPFLYYDTRKQTQPKHELGYLGSLFMGVTFSAGWSPCLGPTLAAMLTLGASTGSTGRAALLLTAYALGHVGAAQPSAEAHAHDRADQRHPAHHRWRGHLQRRAPAAHRAPRRQHRRHHRHRRVAGEAGRRRAVGAAACLERSSSGTARLRRRRCLCALIRTSFMV